MEEFEKQFGCKYYVDYSSVVANYRVFIDENGSIVKKWTKVNEPEFNIAKKLSRQTGKDTIAYLYSWRLRTVVNTCPFPVSVDIYGLVGSTMNINILLESECSIHSNDICNVGAAGSNDAHGDDDLFFMKPVRKPLLCHVITSTTDLAGHFIHAGSDKYIIPSSSVLGTVYRSIQKSSEQKESATTKRSGWLRAGGSWAHTASSPKPPPNVVMDFKEATQLLESLEKYKDGMRPLIGTETTTTIEAKDTEATKQFELRGKLDVTYKVNILLESIVVVYYRKETEDII